MSTSTKNVNEVVAHRITSLNERQFSIQVHKGLSTLWVMSGAPGIYTYCQGIPKDKSPRKGKTKALLTNYSGEEVSNQYAEFDREHGLEKIFAKAIKGGV